MTNSDRFWDSVPFVAWCDDCNGHLSGKTLTKAEAKALANKHQRKFEDHYVDVSPEYSEDF